MNTFHTLLAFVGLAALSTPLAAQTNTANSLDPAPQPASSVLCYTSAVVDSVFHATCNGGNDGAVFITVDADPVPCSSPVVAINEVMYRPTLSNGQNPNTGEQIELIAPPGTNIGCYVLTDGDWTITIPPGTIVPADGIFTIGNNIIYGAGTFDLDAENCACFTEAAGGNGLLILTDGGEYVSLFNAAGVFQQGLLYGTPPALTALNTPPSGALAVGGIIPTALLPGCPVSVTIPAAGSFQTHPGGIAPNASIVRDPDGTGNWATQAGGSINNCNFNYPSTYSLLWSNGATSEDISGLSAGNYTLTITDQFGCTSTLATTINEPAGMSASFAQLPASCGNANGSIDMTPSGGAGGYTFVWNNGAISENLSNVAAGNYTVSITDANGCVDTFSTTLTGSPAFVIVVDSVINATCSMNNGAVYTSVVSGTPPFNFLWGTGQTSPDITDLPVNSYVLGASDANACPAAAVGNITMSLSAVPTIVDSINVDCNGNNNGSIAVDIDPGSSTSYSILWNTGATSEDLSGLAPGFYAITVTDNNDCVSVDSVLLTEPAALATSTAITPADCTTPNGAIDLTVSGGTAAYSFSWNTGANTEDIGSLTSNTYTVTITDANNCLLAQSFVVGNIAGLLAQDTVVDVNCAGETSGAINLGISGGNAPFNFIWNTGATSQNLDNIGAGNYSVTVSDVNGCTFSLASQVDEPAALALNFNLIDDISCFGFADGEIRISITGGTPAYGFAWSDGSNSQNILNLDPATYTVTITDANGCTLTDSATINEPALLTLSLTTANDTIGCDGVQDGIITASTTGGTGSINYNWSNGQTTAQIANLAANSYTLTISDANGCTATAGAAINALQFIDVQAFINSNGLLTDTILTNTSTAIGVMNILAGANYSWTSSSATGTSIADANAANTQITGLLSGTYTITVTGSTPDCSDSDVITLVVIDDFLGMPTAFTPNNDGLNDLLRPVNLSSAFISEFKVFNRFGDVVYNDASLSDGGWDGTLGGQAQARDSYTYVLVYKLPSNNESLTLRGEVMLLR